MAKRRTGSPDITTWVVCDFGLIDAIESGLVKIPQLPIQDSTGAEIPAYFNVWKRILESKPTRGEKGGRADPGAAAGPEAAPANITLQRHRRHPGMKKAPRFVAKIESKPTRPWPLETYEDHAILWATRATARSREYSASPHLSGDEDVSIRMKAILESLMMLADPNVRGSDEMLRAIIEARRKRMN